jgi:CHRD domain.
MSKTAYLVTAGALLTACSSEAPKLTAPVAVPVVSQAMQGPNGSAGTAGANGGNFGTPLSAAEEVMPAGVVNESLARGSAIFQLNAEGTALSYRLIVANIENAFMAHIHRGPAGTNGPIVVWLFPSTAPVQGPTGGGRVDGVIAEGTITAANLVGVLAGQPLSALLADLRSGNAYVNVHTNDGIAPTNTGPGDFPGGEIRGQTEQRGK